MRRGHYEFASRFGITASPFLQHWPQIRKISIIATEIMRIEVKFADTIQSVLICAQTIKDIYKVSFTEL